MIRRTESRLPGEEQIIHFLVKAGNYSATLCDHSSIPERSVYAWIPGASGADARRAVAQFV